MVGDDNGSSVSKKKYQPVYQTIRFLIHQILLLAFKNPALANVSSWFSLLAMYR